MTISSTVANAKWQTGIAITATGTIKFSVAPKPMAWKNKDVSYRANVGIEGEIRFIPDRPVPEDVPVRDVVVEWLDDYTFEDVAVVGGSIGIVGVIAVGAMPLS